MPNTSTLPLSFLLSALGFPSPLPSLKFSPLTFPSLLCSPPCALTPEHALLHRLLILLLLLVRHLVTVAVECALALGQVGRVLVQASLKRHMGLGLGFGFRFEACSTVRRALALDQGFSCPRPGEPNEPRAVGIRVRAEVGEWNRANSECGDGWSWGFQWHGVGFESLQAISPAPQALQASLQRKHLLPPLPLFLPKPSPHHFLPPFALSPVPPLTPHTPE